MLVLRGFVLCHYQNTHNDASVTQKFILCENWKAIIKLEQLVGTSINTASINLSLTLFPTSLRLNGISRAFTNLFQFVFHLRLSQD